MRTRVCAFLIALVVSCGAFAQDTSPGTSEVVRALHSPDTMNAVAPVINIKTLAEEQVQEAKKQATGIKSSLFIYFFEIQMVPFIAACFISLLGTSGIMYRVTRTSSSKMPVTQKAGKSVAINGANVDALLAQARLILDEKTGAVPPRLIVEERPAERENTALLHAKKFGRGQGEFQLAKTLEAQNRQCMWQKRLQLLDPKRTAGEPVGTAKELGIGQGEVGLALSLRRLQDTETRKEQLS